MICQQLRRLASDRCWTACVCARCLLGAHVAVVPSSYWRSWQIAYASSHRVRTMHANINTNRSASKFVNWARASIFNSIWDGNETKVNKRSYVQFEKRTIVGNWMDKLSWTLQTQMTLSDASVIGGSVQCRCFPKKLHVFFFCFITKLPSMKGVKGHDTVPSVTGTATRGKSKNNNLYSLASQKMFFFP